MTDKVPPDWVLIEAAKRCGWSQCNLPVLRKSYLNETWGGAPSPSSLDKAFRALCDMIERYEQPPVDRKVLCAREASRKCAGEYDAAIRAIELYLEGYGE